MFVYNHQDKPVATPEPVKIADCISVQPSTDTDTNKDKPPLSLLGQLGTHSSQISPNPDSCEFINSSKATATQANQQQQVYQQPIPLKQQQQQQQVFAQPASADEINEHMDSIINDVAQGAGTIPYGSDFEFDEETCSSFRDTDSQQNQFDLNESMNSMDKFMSQRSTDSTDHNNKSTKQPAKRKNPGSNKINKQLQAKAEAAAASSATTTTATTVNQIDISKPIDLQQFQQQAGNNQQLIFRLNEDGTVSSQSNNQQFIFNGSGGTAIQLTSSQMTNVGDSTGNQQQQPFQLVSTSNVHGTVAQMTQAVTVLQPPPQEPQAVAKKPEPKKRRKKNEQDESGGGSGGGEKTVQKLINANNEQMNLNK